MQRFQDKIVWITGGGSGIGRSLARTLAAQGAHVAVSGRRVEKLQEVVDEVTALGRRGLAVACDVTEETSIEAAVADVVDHFGRLDIAVANAGFSIQGAIEELSADDWRRQLDTNVVGLAVTARHALPQLRKTQGRLVLVGSVAGEIASPNAGAYHASKYAVRAIGQVLSMETHGSGVTCTTIQPGFVQSEIGKVDNEGRFREDWSERRPGMLLWDTDRAASVMADAIFERKRSFTFTFHGKVVSALGRHFPGFVHFAVTRFVKRGYRRKPSE